jgi:hypothetical protein
VTIATAPAEPFLTPEAASIYLKQHWGIKRTAQSLATYRCQSRGGGPAFRKAGRDVLYGRADLDAWADALLCGAAKLGGREGWKSARVIPGRAA